MDYSVLSVFSALPPELFSFWEAYPWRFGEQFCHFKTFLMETTSYATVLTITGFTIERYLAICHPIRGQRICGRARAVKCICTIWIVACVCALPYPIHTKLFYFVTDPRDKKPVPDSLLCNIPYKWQTRMTYVFQISTFVFFVLPMSVITVMYVLIGMKLRRKEIASSMVGQSHSATTAAARARRAVLRMLVAVVVAFFLCWAPYHSQRLMTLYVQPHQWTPELLTVQSHLFYVSGVLYFLSSTVNPILYHLLSRKFRQAFKRTLCRCCIRLNSLPPFYKLKAKFTVKDAHNVDNYPHRQRGVPADRCNLAHHHHHHHHHHLQPKNARVAKFLGDGGIGTDSAGMGTGGGGAGGGGGGSGAGCRMLLGHPSTNESYIKLSVIRQPSCSTSSTSSSGPHAHSDGRLLAICRHKNCSCRRPAVTGRGKWSVGGDAGRGKKGGTFLGDSESADDRRGAQVMSYPDVIPNRRGAGDLRRHCHETISDPGQQDERPDRKVCLL